MKHIDLNAQGDAIKQFFLALAVEPEGSVVELNGHAVARVLPMAAGPNGATGAWTEAKNARRCDLIDRKYASALTPDEAAELAGLQEEMLRYRQRVAPLPLEDARRLHQQLLRKAGAQQRSG